MHAVLNASRGYATPVSKVKARKQHSGHPITFAPLSATIGGWPSKVTVVLIQYGGGFSVSSQQDGIGNKACIASVDSQICYIDNFHLHSHSQFVQILDELQ